MSGYNYGSESDFEDERPGGGGSGLRKMLEDTLAENKKLLDRLNNAERSKTVTDLLKEMELDPAIAELIPTDSDPKAWLTEKAHLFGKAAPGEKQMERTDLDKDIEVVVPSDEDLAVQLEEQRALEVMMNAQQSGTPASVSTDLLEQLAKFQGSEEELVKFFHKNGAPDSF